MTFQSSLNQSFMKKYLPLKIVTRLTTMYVLTEIEWCLNIQNACKIIFYYLHLNDVTKTFLIVFYFMSQNTL